MNFKIARFFGQQLPRFPLLTRFTTCEALMSTFTCKMAAGGPTRWGIMGAGHISNDWAVGISTLDPKEHQIVAVSARKLESAEIFAKEHGIPTAHGSYEDLAKNPDVEVVYIGTIHSEHFRLAKLALDHGKHVLSEKPLCMNVKQTTEVVNYAQQKKLFLMEGIWSRFFPAHFKLRELIDAGTIGEVKQVIAPMGLIFPKDSRQWRMSAQYGGGTTLHIGSYPIQFATFVFQGLRPLKILAAGHLNSDGVDESASATLIFPEGKTATLLTHSQVTLPNEFLAIGTKGVLKLLFPAWGPTQLVTPAGETLEFLLPKTTKKIHFWNTIGLFYQCQEVRRCILNGLTESPHMTWNDSILLAEIQESIRKQIGVKFPTD